jgi:predicted transcriptional regulator
MKQIPCEYIVWRGLPIIRKGLIKSMINDHGLSQGESAKKLNLTPAAVSHYLSGKRGKMNITDKEIIKEFNSSAERIIKEGDDILVSEICKLCRFLTSKKIFSFR